MPMSINLLTLSVAIGDLEIGYGSIENLCKYYTSEIVRSSQN